MSGIYAHFFFIEIATNINLLLKMTILQKNENSKLLIIYVFYNLFMVISSEFPYLSQPLPCYVSASSFCFERNCRGLTSLGTSEIKALN